MNKLEQIKKDLLEARKSKDELIKNLLSTFIGEYENIAKDDKGVAYTSDVLVENISKKFIKSAKLVNTEDSKLEIKYLEQFLPQVASMEAVKDFLKDKDLTLGGRLIGMAKQHFGGKVDPQTVNQAINELK
tara:strand:- start:208 stop:600 length:393 start_codon:yes stop_codon:yes gene_type:complete